MTVGPIDAGRIQHQAVVCAPATSGSAGAPAQASAESAAAHHSHPPLAVSWAELGGWPSGEPEQIPLRTLFIDITHRCLFKCRGCIERRAMAASKFASLGPDTVQRLVSQFSQQAGQEVLFYGGEPTCHPQFGPLFLFAAQQVPYVRLVTNGALLSEPPVADALAQAASLADVEVRVSLNAGSAHTHALLHRAPGYFDRIVSGMSRLTQLNPRLKLGVSFLVEEANAAEVAQAFQIAAQVGAHYLALRPKTGLHGIGLVPLSEPSRQSLRATVAALRPPAPLSGPSLRLEAWFERYLATGSQPDTTKPYPRCYYCGSCRLVITPPDPGVAWACPYWRSEPRFRVASLAQAPFGSPQFEHRRQQAIGRICPALDCAGVLCNRHEANLAIYQHRNGSGLPAGCVPPPGKAET